MIVSNVKVPIRYTEEQLHKAIRKASGERRLQVRNVQILKRSIDARKRPDLFYVMKLAVNEKPVRPESFRRHISESEPVVVIGAGPAGLFSALTLAHAGVKTTLLERGKCVEERTADVENFWKNGVLDPNSNVQFGEGGAGTFSDGKLNTMTQDPNGLNARVLYEFYRSGAAEEILYDAKPHIGTDVLKDIVRHMRNEFLSLGGEVIFSAKVTDLEIKDDTLKAVIYEHEGESIRLETSYAVLSVGHSARDLFYRLKDLGLEMQQKPFAVGIRMEHPQEMITTDQYGSLDYEELGAAPYKVTAKTAENRGVYSFCMCPGGYVVNASSEEGGLCVNGMSYSERNSRNANSGIVVQVGPADFPSDDVLAGVEFQRDLERRAYKAAGGKIPVQLYGDFTCDRKSDHFGDVLPEMKGAYGFGKIADVLPEQLTSALKEAIPKFGRMIKGFDRPDAILSAVEARTSSPVKMMRNERGESNIHGLYPAGEGAGYAGGITSAAMDGIRVAEWILDSMEGIE